MAVDKGLDRGGKVPTRGQPAKRGVRGWWRLPGALAVVVRIQSEAGGRWHKTPKLSQGWGSTHGRVRICCKRTDSGLGLAVQDWAG
ncbi:hypothetical protein ACLB2K_063824 [Fragaria x ananassa]